MKNCSQLQFEVFIYQVFMAFFNQRLNSSEVIEVDHIL